MTYAGLITAADPKVPHLGGSISGGDPFTYCPRVWDYVVPRFGISSVLDLGSGHGNASVYFHNKGLRVVAVEGFRESVDAALYPTIQHDLTQSPVYTRVDLVHCQEVVEHIEERHLDNLIASLLCGKIILMTHAVPGQTGYHHVNLQPSEYWINHLQRAGCNLLEEDTRRIRELAKLDCALYIGATGMLFCNTKRL